MPLNLKPALFALCLLACSADEESARFSAADEAAYEARFEAQQKAALAGGGIGRYDPLERVKGAAWVAPLPIAEELAIPASALDQAVNYASERNSSAFMVWKDGALQRESYFGEYDQAALINAKSLAKPLTAIAIGRAIALGHIKSLDQPAADFITEWEDDPGRKQITLRHLLGMRSGLLSQGTSPVGKEHVRNRAYLHPRHDEVIIHEYPLTDEPGTRYEYSNANAEVIAPIIERATGLRYGTFITQAILEPLGAPGGTVWVNRPGGTAHAGCCIQLPGQTWLKLAILLLQGGVWEDEQLLPEGYVTQMRTPSPQNPHAGLGVWVAGEYVERRGSLHPSIEIGRTYHSEPYVADDLFLFDGNGKQVVYIIPSEGLIILRTGGFPAKDKEWDNSHLPNLIVRALRSESPGPT